MKKSWQLFGSCRINSTANPAHFHLNWAVLAVLIIRQISNGSHDFFSYFQHIVLYCLIKNPQTTLALTFLTHNILGISGLYHLV